MINHLKLSSEIGRGVYGEMKKGYIKSIQQTVITKVLSTTVTRSEMLAEAAITREFSGIKWFPYFYGVVEPSRLIFEFGYWFRFSESSTNFTLGASFITTSTLEVF